MPRKRKPKTDNPKSSMGMCWSCIHAYGDDCFFIPFEERHWVKDYAYLPRRRASRQQGIVMVREVRKCEQYEYGRKGLA